MKFLLFLVATYCMFANSIGRNINGESHKLHDVTSAQFSIVANVDGKSFFIDTSAYRTWTAASDLCQEAEMNLASITSAAQFEALKDSDSVMFKLGGYWLSGRDSLKVTQFVWNTTSEQLSESFFPFESDDEFGYQSCVYFARSYTGVHTLSHTPCHLSRWVMCEA